MSQERVSLVTSTTGDHSGGHLQQAEEVALENENENELYIDEAEKLGPMFLLIVCCASVGGLLFGYDTGIISGVLVLLGDDLGGYMTDFQLEVITAITSVGGLFGSFMGGMLPGVLGRKNLIALACTVFMLDAIFMAFAWSYHALVWGRFIVGLAIGMASTTVPVYIAEVSPANHRGKLVSLNSMTTTGGQVLAYLMGIVFADVTGGWRYMVGLAALPPLVFLLLIKFIPESPRFLIANDKFREAELAVAQLYPRATNQQVSRLVSRLYAEHIDNNRGSDGIISISDNSQKLSLRKLSELFGVPSNYRALIVGCGLMASQQLCGFNSFMYYSATIFKTAGFRNPVIVSLVVSGTNFVFTGVSLVLIDIVGRRAMLLRTMWIMVLALIITGIFFNANPQDNNSTDSNTSSYIVVIATFVYVAAYASALGNIPWQAIEFLPISVRALGSMMISYTNWTINSVVSATFLTMMKTLKPVGTFGIYAAFTFITYIGVYFCYPDVTGIPLEDVNKVFEHGLIQHGNSYQRLQSH